MSLFDIINPDGSEARQLKVDSSGSLNVNIPGGVTATIDETTLATSAKQDTGNTSLASIATNTTGVATAANQATANTSLASIATNTTGVATAANQATANTSLASLDTKHPAKGTAVMTASTPVTIASDDTLTAAIKSDLDTIKTNTSTVAGSPTTVAQVTLGHVSPTQLASHASTKGVWVQNDFANSGINVRVGDSSTGITQGIQLAPGDSIFLPVDNSNRLYAIGESGSPLLNYMVL